MMLKLASSVLLLWACEAVLASSDEYFQKAVFPALKAKNGHFSSQIQFFEQYQPYGSNFTYNYTHIVKERHSFNLNSGNFKEFHIREKHIRENHNTDKRKEPFYEVVYINGSEIYKVVPWACRSESLQSFKTRGDVTLWSPYFVFGQNYYQVLGPSVLLEVFYERLAKDKDSVKCEALKDETKKNPKKCSITIVKNETVQLEYSFVDGEQYTMYPEQIEVRSLNETWSHEFIYSNFTASFEGDLPSSTDLPIGKGCRRIPEAESKYPQIQANFGDKFEIEYDVRFKYPDPDASYDYRIRKFGRMNFTTRTYSGKIFVDKANSINIAEGIDEATNASIRTIYDAKTRLLHQVTIEDNKCTTYNLTSNKTLNWFYLQDSLVKRPELYYAKTSNLTGNSSGNSTSGRHSPGGFSSSRYRFGQTDSYSYLQEQNLNDVPCSVFENKIYYFSRNYGDYEERWSWRRNSTASPPLPEKRANKNKVRGREAVIATHWFAKESNNWPGNSNGFSVPKRIQMIISDDPFASYGGGIAFLKIDVKTFSSTPKEPPKFDKSKCIQA